jgi:ATP-dependent DNA helicase PIF1
MQYRPSVEDASSSCARRPGHGGKTWRDASVAPADQAGTPKRGCGPAAFEIPAAFYEGSSLLCSRRAPLGFAPRSGVAPTPGTVAEVRPGSAASAGAGGCFRPGQSTGASAAGMPRVEASAALPLGPPAVVAPPVVADDLQSLPAAFLECRHGRTSTAYAGRGARAAEPRRYGDVAGRGTGASSSSSSSSSSCSSSSCSSSGPSPASAPDSKSRSAAGGYGPAAGSARPKPGAGLGDQVKFEDLSCGQQGVFRMSVLEGKNVLMLGEGGTGKSLTISAIAADLKRRKVPYLITASTGRAALLIGGSTVHSAFGIGLGTGTPEDLVTRVSSNAWVVKELRRTKLVVIDEVSMVSADLLFKLDFLTRAIRRNFKEPFGGMQVVGSGDMMQLPPVKAEFCFLHPCFESIFPKSQCVELKHNFRQDQDAGFRKILHAVRWGNVTPEVDAALQARVGLEPPAGVPATVIYPLRQQVDALNEAKMQALPGEMRLFAHTFGTAGTVSDKQAAFLRAMLLSSAPCCDVLGLKVGAQVMHTRNNKDTRKVHGSQGTVAGFGPLTGHPIVKFADGTTHAVEPFGWTSPCLKATLTQYPLIVAWAVTIHKIQGATLDAVVADVGERVFEAGQAYTALSRVRRLEDLYLVAWSAASARPHPAAVAFHASLSDAAK